MNHKEFIGRILKPIQCSELDTEEVRAAALDMPAILASTVSDATGKVYFNAWIWFQRWCFSNKRVCYPASKETVGLYFICLGKKLLSIASIDTARSAISWFIAIATP